MKNDFAVITFGQHYSLVKRKDITGRDIVGIRSFLWYCCYKNDIWKYHIDQDKHSEHYVDISRAMVEKFVAFFI